MAALVKIISKLRLSRVPTTNNTELMGKNVCRIMEAKAQKVAIKIITGNPTINKHTIKEKLHIKKLLMIIKESRFLKSIFCIRFIYYSSLRNVSFNSVD
jgi:hypothetical protein|tara:strand:+ start:895 stop:1191 length:297 start_codon:yes stop_codon:yes gene_type:complete